MKNINHEDLRQFTGDLKRFAHPLNPNVIYTPGIQFLAKRAEAHWLIDAIVSYYGSPVMQRAIDRDSRLAGHQFWQLKVKNDNSASLTARADKGVAPFITQKFTWTDFPMSVVDVWAFFDSHWWTLYLPSEH